MALLSVVTWATLWDGAASLFSPPTIKASLYLWASSVAFFKASSIAASSWALLVPVGFLTASTWTTRPVLVLTSIVDWTWTLDVASGLETFLAFNSSILFFDYSTFLADSSAFFSAALTYWWREIDSISNEFFWFKVTACEVLIAPTRSITARLYFI